MRMQNRTGMATAGAMHSTSGSYFVPNPAAATLAIQGQRSTAQFHFFIQLKIEYISLLFTSMRFHSHSITINVNLSWAIKSY